MDPLKKICAIIISGLVICLCSCAARTADKPVGKISALSLEIPAAYVDREYMLMYIDESDLSDGNRQMDLLYALDCGEAVAYIFQNDVLTTASRKFGIYLQNKETGDHRLLKTLTYENQRMIFSAEADQNYLFFSSVEIGENRAYIDKISLLDGKESCIYSENTTTGRIPIISLSGGKLYCYKDEPDESVSIISYDTDSGQAETVRKKVLSVNPFDRAVSGAYAVDSGGTAVVFAGNNSIKTNIRSDEFDLISARGSAVMWKSYESERLYIGDTDSGEVREMPCRGYMGAGFTSNGFYICANDYSEKNSYERISFYNDDSVCVYESAAEGQSAAFAHYSNSFDSVLRERENEIFIYSLRQ